MSDILIKNMKMPETCADCNFSTWNGFESVYCDVNAEFIPRKEWKEKRQDWCPLIEVPTPHGDLIDRDAIQYANNTTFDEDYVRRKTIMKMPTIIESEGCEDG